MVDVVEGEVAVLPCEIRHLDLDLDLDTWTLGPSTRIASLINPQPQKCWDCLHLTHLHIHIFTHSHIPFPFLAARGLMSFYSVLVMIRDGMEVLPNDLTEGDPSQKFPLCIFLGFFACLGWRGVVYSCLCSLRARILGLFFNGIDALV